MTISSATAEPPASVIVANSSGVPNPQTVRRRAPWR
jgi:hypothetical protein